MRVLRAILSAALLLLAGAGMAAPAWAHANLERAEPVVGSALDQAPTQLRLFFSEPLESSFSRVQVLDAKREAVDRGDSRVAPGDPRSMIVSVPSGLADGVYTVSWRTLSAVDGHTVNGAYPLIVGPPPAEGVAAVTASSSEARFAPETAIGRWWFTLAAGVLFGTVLAWRVVFRPLFGRANPAALPPAAQRAQRLAVLSSVLLLIGTLYGAVAQAATASDVPVWAAFGSPLVELLSRGRYASLWWPRLAVVVLGLTLVSWRGVRGRTGELALAACAVALLTSSLNSHGAALLSGAYLGIAADWLHFLAVSTWIGGLASLIYVLPTTVQASAGSGERVLAQAVTRFSNLALIAVGAIVVTGVFQAWLEVGSWEGLVQTAYGLSVTTKVGLLLLMLLLGAFNLLVVRPRLAALAGKGSGAAVALGQRFAQAVRAELALGVLVLVVTGVLTGVTPAREEMARRANSDLQGGPVDRQVSSQGLNVRIQISPASLGVNRFAVSVPGVNPSDVERVQLTLTYLDAELGSQPLVLPEGSTPGTWETSSPLLSQGGIWQADLLIRRAGQDDARGSVRFLVAGPTGAPQPATATGAYPLLPSPPVALAYALVAAGLVVAVVGAVRGRRSPRQRRLQQQGALVAAGLLAVVCGG
ncbi:MAG TPA: CopD family protein, partial [Chloroflexota bacterium]|nr:CopD family protein [Chloroflexota bacterium]